MHSKLSQNNSHFETTTDIMKDSLGKHCACGHWATYLTLLICSCVLSHDTVYHFDTEE